MKLSKISIAIAALSGAFAGQAMAIDASLYSTANTTDLYVSGASAQDGGLKNMMRRVCATGTLDVYVGSGANANQAIYYCQVDATQVPGMTKPNIAVHKSSVGGSGNGVQPVANSLSLAFMDLNILKANPGNCGATSAVAAVPPVAPDTIGLPAYTTRTCTIASTSSVVTEAGFSDVEPALFGASAADIAKLSSFSPNGLMFNSIVTKNVRDALQAAQGLTVGAEDEANMPSLTKTQIAALYSGNIATWSQFADRFGVALSFTDPNVYVARRVGTSGTEASFEVYFLNQRCAANVANMVVGNDTTSCGATGVPNTVFEGSGTGNVLTCMNTHNTAGRGAIGITSTEYAAVAGDGWRNIKINGYAPTLLNQIDGKYDFWMEQSMQYRNATSGNALAGDKKTFFDALITKIGDPVVVSAIDAGFAHTWGKSGLLALATSGYVPNAPMDESTPAAITAAQAAAFANPVSTTTKSPLGYPNNCIPPVLFNSTVVLSK